MNLTIYIHYGETLIDSYACTLPADDDFAHAITIDIQPTITRVQEPLTEPPENP